MSVPPDKAGPTSPPVRSPLPPPDRGFEEALGTRFQIEVAEDEATITATCSGADLGLLIGKHGQTIDALQYVANAAVFRGGAGKPVTVDAAGYRARRRQTLEGIALRSADRAIRGERQLEKRTGERESCAGPAAW